MRTRRLVVLLLALSPAASLADCNARNQDPLKAHIELSLAALPPLRFYRAADRAAPPVMHLDDRGLHLGNVLSCSWPGESFQATTEPNRVLGFDGAGVSRPCPGDLPVKSGFGDGGIGTAVLCVEVKSVRKDFATVSYRGADLYLDLRNLPSGSWSHQPPGK